MEKYTTIIDELLKQMEAETTSAHELSTKALNYEYFQGMLYGLYKTAEKELQPADFFTLYDYRRADRDRISEEANKATINKVYNIVRAATIPEPIAKQEERAAIANRVYNLDIYGNSDTTPEEIAEGIRENPAETIKYLLDIIDDLKA